MKTWSRFIFATFLAGVTCGSALAQSQAVVSVGITKIAVSTGTSGVTSITVVSPGSLYSSAPTVTIAGGGGSGATATAVVAGGTVTGINITSAGSGYTTPPSVSLTGGGGTGATASAGLTLPTVTFANPNESSGASGSRIDISALAVGTFPVSGYTYTFFVNGISIGAATPNPPNGIPAVVSWTPPQPGSYSITVTANDGISGTVSSLPVRYFATGTQLISPLNNTLVPVGSSFVIKGDATPGGGFIKQIAFYVDGSPILNSDGSAAVDATAPYSFIYTPPFGVGTTHQVEVRATDNNNNQVSLNGTAVATIQMVNPVGALPTVSITTPSNGAALAIPNYAATPSAKVPVTVTANDSDGILSRVELYVDGVLYATGTGFPYTFNWQPPVIGTFKLVALAYDDKNNVTASSTNAVTISAPPSVSITSPINNATVSLGTPQIISANAADSDGTVTSVQFYANNVLIPGTVVFTAPSTYSISWIPSVKGDQTELTALASDNLGLTTLSSVVIVKVTDTGGGGGAPVIGLAPIVAVTSPLPGTQLFIGAPATLTASASDPDGNVTSVQFFVNGVSVGIDNTYPYSTTWTPAALGTYNVTAKVTDNAGNTVTSLPIVISVIDSSSGLPSVAITAPTNGAAFTVGATQTITASATDDGSIAGVQFYVNGQPLGPLVTNFPYRTPWTPGSIGAYTLIARATDNTGNQSTSAPVTVTITSGSPPAVALTSPGTNLTVGLGTSINVSATASDADGTVTSVRFTANGIQLAMVSQPPYTTSFTPTAAGVYTLVAEALDNVGNVTASTPQTLTVLAGAGVPIVTLNNPSADTTISADSSLLLSASADISSGTISKVEFYAGSTLLTTLAAYPYTYVWRPASIGVYAIRAVAYSGSGQGVSSSVSTITVTPATSAPGSIYVNLTSPTNNQTIVAFRNLTFTAVTNIPSSKPDIDFYFNGFLFQTVSAAPYQTTRNPSAPGRYEFYAVMRVAGATYTSSPVYVTVLPNQPPSVSITAPTNGVSVTVGTAVTIKASASDPDDAIDTVQFLVNGQPLSTAQSFPYTAAWNPIAEGVYTLTAVAKDSLGSVAGNQVTSAPIYVRVVAPAGSGGTAPDAIYGGTYFSAGESGKFAAITLAGKDAVFIAYSTTGGSRSYFYSGLPVDASGGFAKTDSSGKLMLNGVSSDSGVSGTLDGSRLTFIGPITFGGSTTTVPSGYYAGNLSGKLDSTVGAIVGLDSSITVYVSSGSFTDAGSGRLATAGTFSLTTMGGNLLTGKVDIATGLFTGNLSGSNGGGFTGALTSGGSFSDGALRNLSTRGQVGTGSNVLIAGFVVGGSSSKQVLIRAIGPSLTQFGITGALADPQLTIFQGGTTIASNDNWGGSSPLVSAAAQAGAFALDPASKDAVILTTLNPGAYTAQVSGVGGTTGVALVELYDRDAAAAFSPQKILNVATRGVVSSGQGALIAGFIVNGTVSKKLLIRAVGPGLTAFGVTGALADPILRVIRSDNVVVRENDNWETGNDATLIADASSKAGAFALVPGSKDSALLFNLPPGTYTAQVSGANNSGGVALVEVYEVP